MVFMLNDLILLIDNNCVSCDLNLNELVHVILVSIRVDDFVSLCRILASSFNLMNNEYKANVSYISKFTYN